MASAPSSYSSSYSSSSTVTSTVVVVVSEKGQRLQKIVKDSLVELEKPKTKGDYTSTLSYDEMYNKTQEVLGCTFLGGCVGAGLGCAVSGLGAGPGIGIGAAVGLGVGLYRVHKWGAYNFRQWAKNQDHKTLQKMFSDLTEEIGDKRYECPLTYAVPIEPVKLTTAPNFVFEREALIKAIDLKGICPISGKPVTLKEIRTAYAATLGIKKECQAILNNTLRSGRFTADQIKGIQELQKDFEKNLMSFIKKEQENLYNQCDSGKIDFDTYVDRCNELTKDSKLLPEYDEASAKHFKKDDEKEPLIERKTKN